MEKTAQSADRTTQFGEDSIHVLMMRYSLPAIVAMLASTMFSIINMAFVGRSIGAPGIAAIAVCAPISMIQGAIGQLIGNGCAAAVSISLGRGEREGAQTILGCSVFYGLLVSFLNMTLGFLFTDVLLTAFGASASILPLAREYLQVTLIGMLCSIFSSMNPMLRIEGFPQRAMMTQILMTVINVLLAPLFIFVFDMGIRGAALGSLCGQLASSAWILSFLLHKDRTVRLERKYIHPQAGMISFVLQLGLPSFLMQLTQSLLSIVMNRSLGTYGGDLAISAWGVTNNINSVVAQPIFGLNQAVQPIIGYNYGAKQYKRVRHALLYSLSAATVFSLAGWLVIRLFPEPILAFFNKDPDLIAIGSRMLIVFRMLIFVTGFQQAGAVYFQYSGKPKTSILLTLSRQVFILMPCVLILPRFFQFDGILYSGPISDVLSTIITGIFILLELKRLDKLIKEEPFPAADPALS